ncbi:MAG TPA: ABC transporter permease subunit [Solirubrobacterales bacterium]|nr:ABC transporter permease subunit [Solirubrobacterales bacterium]
MNLLRSEWIKLWSVRTTWTMLGIGLLAEALFAGLYVGLAPLDEIGSLEQVETGTGLLLVLSLVLGVLIVTTEFRHGTASSTFLVTPRRWPVLMAKLAVALGVGLLAGLAFVLVNGGLALPLLESREGSLPAAGDIASVYAGVVVSLGLICAFGYGVGTIVRNQVGAILAAIAFFFILSPLPELLPGSIGDYFPAQAIGSLHGTEGDNLGQIAGGLVLSAWVLGLVTIGTALVCRRDVSE